MNNSPITKFSSILRGEKPDELGPTPEVVGIAIPEKNELLQTNEAIIDEAERQLDAAA
jgi:hypothetical protein